jgi:hypothetical protein
LDRVIASIRPDVAGDLQRRRRVTNSGGNGVPRHRSKAWIYYTVIAIGALFGIPSSPAVAIIVAIAAGFYALYLYRGGTVVIWFW